METKDLKIGQKIIVGNYDCDYPAEVLENNNGTITAKINRFGVELVRELNYVDYWLAGVVE